MRPILALLGNLLLLASLAGGALLVLGPSDLPIVQDAEEAEIVLPAQVGWEGTGGMAAAPAPRTTATPTQGAVPTATANAYLPITHVSIASIGLDADVVTARLVKREGGTTWEVPAHVAGHAQYTAGAGGLGNAVLLGHVESRNAGNVFHDLERVQPGDLVRLASGEQTFDYRVVEVRAVSRTDTSVLEATEVPSVSLITCTGVWLPTIWDYTERLVVRAELL